MDLPWINYRIYFLYLIEKYIIHGGTAADLTNMTSQLDRISVFNISVIIKFDNMYIRFNDVLRKQVLPVYFFQQIGFTTSSEPGYYFWKTVLFGIDQLLKVFIAVLFNKNVEFYIFL